MFGWEFPPVKSGGLGTACHALVKGLNKNGIQITFVMPYAPDGMNSEYATIISAEGIMNKVKFRFINSIIKPYITSGHYNALRNGSTNKELYGNELYDEVYRFSLAAAKMAEGEDFDIIHCHDWMTYPAGIIAKKISGKPLVVHIHNTVFDRSSLNPSSYEYDLEKKGFQEADKIIAISNFVKNRLVKKYGIEENKIEVVHWGVDESYELNEEVKSPFGRKKVVLFLGRVTMQKGPDYFIEAAKKVLDFEPNIIFVVVGNGDMMPQIINRTMELGMLKNVVFSGWLNDKEVKKAYKIADVFVMPSVAEPFGMVALEAMQNKVPVIVSKQSGVAEILKNCFKVDFWDVNELANKIVNLLRHKSLKHELKENSYREVKNYDIYKPAKKIRSLYKEVEKW